MATDPIKRLQEVLEAKTGKKLNPDKVRDKAHSNPGWALSVYERAKDEFPEYGTPEDFERAVSTTALGLQKEAPAVPEIPTVLTATGKSVYQDEREPKPKKEPTRASAYSPLTKALLFTPTEDPIPATARNVQDPELYVQATELQNQMEVASRAEKALADVSAKYGEGILELTNRALAGDKKLTKQEADLVNKAKDDPSLHTLLYAAEQGVDPTQSQVYRHKYNLFVAENNRTLPAELQTPRTYASLRKSEQVEEVRRLVQGQDKFNKLSKEERALLTKIGKDGTEAYEAKQIREGLGLDVRELRDLNETPKEYMSYLLERLEYDQWFGDLGKLTTELSENVKSKFGKDIFEKLKDLDLQSLNPSDRAAYEAVFNDADFMRLQQVGKSLEGRKQEYQELHKKYPEVTRRMQEGKKSQAAADAVAKDLPTLSRFTELAVKVGSGLFINTAEFLLPPSKVGEYEKLMNEKLAIPTRTGSLWNKAGMVTSTRTEKPFRSNVAKKDGTEYHYDNEGNLVGAWDSKTGLRQEVLGDPELFDQTKKKTNWYSGVAMGVEVMGDVAVTAMLTRGIGGGLATFTEAGKLSDNGYKFASALASYAQYQNRWIQQGLQSGMTFDDAVNYSSMVSAAIASLQPIYGFEAGLAKSMTNEMWKGLTKAEIQKFIKNPHLFWAKVGKTAKDILGESFEEGLEQLAEFKVNTLANHMYGSNLEEGFNSWADAKDSAMEIAFVTMVGTGPLSAVRNATDYTKESKWLREYFTAAAVNPEMYRQLVDELRKEGKLDNTKYYYEDEVAAVGNQYKEELQGDNLSVAQKQELVLLGMEEMQLRSEIDRSPDAAGKEAQDILTRYEDVQKKLGELVGARKASKPIPAKKTTVTPTEAVAEEQAPVETPSDGPPVRKGWKAEPAREVDGKQVRTISTEKKGVKTTEFQEVKGKTAKSTSAPITETPYASYQPTQEESNSLDQGQTFGNVISVTESADGTVAKMEILQGGEVIATQDVDLEKRSTEDQRSDDLLAQIRNKARQATSGRTPQPTPTPVSTATPQPKAPKQSALKKAAERASRVLTSLGANVEFVVHESLDEMQKATGHRAAHYDGSTGRIHLAEGMDATRAVHESWHPVLNHLRETNRPVYDRLVKFMSSELKKNPYLAKKIGAFANLYKQAGFSEDVQTDEALTEFLTQAATNPNYLTANGKKSLAATILRTFQKFRDWFPGADTRNAAELTDAEIVELIQAASRAFAGEGKAAEILKKTFPPATLADFEQNPTELLKRSGWAIVSSGRGLKKQYGDNTKKISYNGKVMHLVVGVEDYGSFRGEVFTPFGKYDSTTNIFFPYRGNPIQGSGGFKVGETVFDFNLGSYQVGKPPQYSLDSTGTTVDSNKMPGFGKGIQAVRDIVREYKAANKIKKADHPPVTKLFPAVSKVISAAYERMEHAPTDPRVVRAYEAMMQEAISQYEFIVGSGIEVIKHEGSGEPYANSAEMLADLEAGRIRFLPNEVAFGSPTDKEKFSDNIGLRKSGIKIPSGYELTNSEVFRVVHDFFGHGILGNEFGAIGEENATLQHVSMFSDEAAPAVIAQTRGQNSWVNFSGANEEALNLFKQARQEERKGNKELAEELRAKAVPSFKFAEPKIGLLPNIYNFQNYDTAERLNRAIESGIDVERQGLPKNVRDSSSTLGLTDANEGGFKRTDSSEDRTIGSHTVKVKTVFEPETGLEQAVKTIFPKATIDSELLEIGSPEAYHYFISKAKFNNPQGASVYVYPKEDYSEMRLFITPDGMAGIALKPDGDLVSVFNDPTSKKANRVPQLLLLGIKQGAKKADAFDTVLPDYYSKFGFRAVARVPFDPDQQPQPYVDEYGFNQKGWDQDTFSDFSDGRPDVVMLVYDGGSRSDIHERVGQFDSYNGYVKPLLPTSSYDEAVQEQEAALHGASPQFSLTPESAEIIAKSVESRVVPGKTFPTWIQKGEDVSVDSVRRKARTALNTATSKMAINEILGLGVLESFFEEVNKLSKAKTADLLSVFKKDIKAEIDSQTNKKTFGLVDKSARLKSMKKGTAEYKKLEGSINRTKKNIAELKAASQAKTIAEVIQSLQGMTDTKLASGIFGPLIVRLNFKDSRGLRAFDKLSDKDYAKKVDNLVEDIKVTLKDNLRTLYNSISEEVRAISKLWYDGANIVANEFSKAYGVTLEQSAAIIAILSPKKDWFANVHVAQAAMHILSTSSDGVFTQEHVDFFVEKSKGYKDQAVKIPEVRKLVGKKISELPDFHVGIYVRAEFETGMNRVAPIRIPSGQVVADGTRLASFNDYKGLASVVSVFRDGSDENISEKIGNENKVRNFYVNISDPNNPNAVTIDTHAYAAAYIYPFAASSAEVVFSAPEYAIVADAYRELANEIGLLPRELQSITWEAVRVLFPAYDKMTRKVHRKVDSIIKSRNEGKLTKDEARKQLVEGADLNETSWKQFGDSVAAQSQNDARGASEVFGYLGDRYPNPQGDRSGADRRSPAPSGVYRGLDALTQFSLEEEQIVERAKADGTYLKAPNGKDSNLNPKQWAQVRTQAFKNWFGDWEADPENASKVVDENGEPLVVYRGDTPDKSIFTGKEDPSTLLQGNIFFSDNKFVARGYQKDGRSVYNKLMFPRESEGSGFFETFLNIRSPKKVNANGRSWLDVGIDDLATRAQTTNDGLIVTDVVDQYGDGTQFVAFSPTQIKSATSNIGTFDVNNPDIRFSLIADARDYTAFKSIEADPQTKYIATGMYEGGFDAVPQDFGFNEWQKVDGDKKSTQGKAYDVLQFPSLFTAFPELAYANVNLTIDAEAIQVSPDSTYTGEVTSTQPNERSLAESVVRAFRGYAQQLLGFRRGTPETALKSLELESEQDRVDIYEIARSGDAGYAAQFSLEAWHGSPYFFYRFLTEMIGTGEGNQSFGWGLYFTELKSIAKEYAERLAFDPVKIQKEIDFTASKIEELSSILSSIESSSVAKELTLDIGRRKNEIAALKSNLEYLNKKKNLSKNLYRVTLHKGKTPDQYTWLEWDKKVPEEIVERLKGKVKKNNYTLGDHIGTMPLSGGIKPVTGKEFYEKISSLLGGDKEASLFLLENGIGGIKYPAESISSGATSDTARGFNYVVFDENAVTIEERVQFSLIGDVGATVLDQYDPEGMRMQRKQTTLSETEDVQRDWQIVRFSLAYSDALLNGHSVQTATEAGIQNVLVGEYRLPSEPTQFSLPPGDTPQAFIARERELFAEALLNANKQAKEQIVRDLARQFGVRELDILAAFHNNGMLWPFEGYRLTHPSIRRVNTTQGEFQASDFIQPQNLRTGQDEADVYAYQIIDAFGENAVDTLLEEVAQIRAEMNPETAARATHLVQAMLTWALDNGNIAVETRMWEVFRELGTSVGREMAARQAYVTDNKLKSVKATATEAVVALLGHTLRQNPDKDNLLAQVENDAAALRAEAEPTKEELNGAATVAVKARTPAKTVVSLIQKVSKFVGNAFKQFSFAQTMVGSKPAGGFEAAMVSGNPTRSVAQLLMHLTTSHTSAQAVYITLKGIQRANEEHNIFTGTQQEINTQIVEFFKQVLNEQFRGVPLRSLLNLNTPYKVDLSKVDSILDPKVTAEEELKKAVEYVYSRRNNGKRLSEMIMNNPVLGEMGFGEALAVERAVSEHMKKVYGERVKAAVAKYLKDEAYKEYFGTKEVVAYERRARSVAEVISDAAAYGLLDHATFKAHLATMLFKSDMHINMLEKIASLAKRRAATKSTLVHREIDKEASWLLFQIHPSTAAKFAVDFFSYVIRGMLSGIKTIFYSATFAGLVTSIPRAAARSLYRAAQWATVDKMQGPHPFSFITDFVKSGLAKEMFYEIFPKVLRSDADADHIQSFIGDPDISTMGGVPVQNRVERLTTKAIETLAESWKELQKDPTKLRAYMRMVGDVLGVVWTAPLRVTTFLKSFDQLVSAISIPYYSYVEAIEAGRKKGLRGDDLLQFAQNKAGFGNVHVVHEEAIIQMQRLAANPENRYMFVLDDAGEVVTESITLNDPYGGLITLDKPKTRFRYKDLYGSLVRDGLREMADKEFVDIGEYLYKDAQMMGQPEGQIPVAIHEFLRKGKPAILTELTAENHDFSYWKFAANLAGHALMPFGRIVAQTLSVMYRYSLIGALDTAIKAGFFGQKAAYVGKRVGERIPPSFGLADLNGQIVRRVRSNQEIGEQLILTTATQIAALMGLAAHMFDWDDEEGLVLKEDRKVDVTFQRTGNYQSDRLTDPTEKRLSIKHGESPWVSYRYAMTGIPAFAPVGMLRDRLVYGGKVDAGDMMWALTLGPFQAILDQTFAQSIQTMFKFGEELHQASNNPEMDDQNVDVLAATAQFALTYLVASNFQVLMSGGNFTRDLSADILLAPQKENYFSLADEFTGTRLRAGKYDNDVLAKLFYNTHMFGINELFLTGGTLHDSWGNPIPREYVAKEAGDMLVEGLLSSGPIPFASQIAGMQNPIPLAEKEREYAELPEVRLTRKYKKVKAPSLYYPPKTLSDAEKVINLDPDKAEAVVENGKEVSAEVVRDRILRMRTALTLNVGHVMRQYIRDNYEELDRLNEEELTVTFKILREEAIALVKRQAEFYGSGPIESLIVKEQIVPEMIQRGVNEELMNRFYMQPSEEQEKKVVRPTLK